MSGRVIFTNDRDFEVSRIRELSAGYSRKYYVFGKPVENMEFYRDSLKDFCFFDLSDTLSPSYGTVFSENSLSDFFVLKQPRLSKIMDRNIEMHQTVLKGFKLVVDNHPFLEKKDAYWCYFLWSFFNKSLLGYPHCYAFQLAKRVNGIDPFDCPVLAKKVAPATETTIDKIYQDDIITERIELSQEIKEEYQAIKKNLFETETKPWLIVRKLKKFLNEKVPRLRKGLGMLDLWRVHSRYMSGERTLVVSDAQVDIFLEKEFWNHIRNVNSFMETLRDACGTKQGI